jgi:hypothetical protein
MFEVENGYRIGTKEPFNMKVCSLTAGKSDLRLGVELWPPHGGTMMLAAEPSTSGAIIEGFNAINNNLLPTEGPHLCPRCFCYRSS